MYPLMRGWETMKKWGMAFLASLIIFVLAACNDTAVPQEGAKNNSELTLEEVYQKAIDRQNQLESVTAIVKMDQVMSFGSGEEGLEIKSKSDLTMDMITEPLSLYMEGTMGMGEPTAEEETMIDLKMYMTKEGLYMQDSLADHWTKLPTDNFDAIMGQTASQVNASQQLKEMKEFITDFKFEQSDKNYVLKLDTSSEKFKAYLLEQLNVNEMVGVPEEAQQLLQETKFEKVDYEILIDKKTFNITEMTTNVDFIMNMEGNGVRTSSNTSIAFNNFNGVESITIPKEVIDKAIEVEY